MKKVLIITSISILAILTSMFYIRWETKAEGKFTAARVQLGDMVIAVTATGTLQAVTTVQVGSQISGAISALFADFNDHVKKGQVLAQIDPTFLKAQVAQAEADLDKASTSAELAKRQYERSESLFQGNMVSEADRDANQAAYEQTKSEIKSAQANLDRMKTNLAYATIISPIDGVVISRDIDIGQTVAASLQAPTLFTIAQDLTKMEVKTSVDEADIGKVQEGQLATFTVDAYPERNFEGRVKQIRLAPEVEQNVVSYNVILEVSNPEMLLKPGMTANVTIEIQRRNNVLKVPSAALRFRLSDAGPAFSRSARSDSVRIMNSSLKASVPSTMPDSTQHNRNAVWILGSDRKPHPVPVEAGISDGGITEIITDKLSEGDSVITGQEGVQATSNSQQVNPFAPRFGGGRR